MAVRQESSVRLDSWKDIAAYLDRDVRTVMRWEKTRGLPVYRVPGGSRGAVYAYSLEIEQWLRGQGAVPAEDLAVDGEAGFDQEGMPDRAVAPGPGDGTALRLPWVQVLRSWRTAGLVACVVLVVVLLAGGHMYSSAHAAQPASATFTADSIQAWDDEHHLLWEHRFPQPFANTAKVGDARPSGDGTYPYDEVNRAFVYDLFGDGRGEVLAITLFRRGSASDDPRQVLSCFSPAGKLLWSYEPQDVLTFGSRTYRAPWELLDLIVSDEPGRKTIWVSVEAYTWGKSFIARLDADGHASMQYVHSGQIGTFQRFHSPLGAMLWIGGFNDEYDTASLAIMRDTQPFAVSPQTPGSRYTCSNCAQGDSFAYFVFPRYELSRVLHNPNNRVYSVTSDADQVEVREMEISRADQVLYDFSNDNDPHPLRVNYSSSFWPNHLELERQGRVTHPLEACPDRLHPPPVRVYQNGQWGSLTLPSALCIPSPDLPCRRQSR